MVSDGHSTSFEALYAQCRGAGLKATPQRLAILRALVESRAHPSPEEVFRVVKATMPTVSLGTIYKTLDALEQAGLSRLVSHTGDTKRYDGNLSPHHHLVCTACGSISDFSHPSLDAISMAKVADGFEAKEMNVQITGICATCSQASTTKNTELVKE